MQALRRRVPGRLASPLEIGRWEFEYRRFGTRCLTAAFDVHRGSLRCGDEPPDEARSPGVPGGVGAAVPDADGARRVGQPQHPPRRAYRRVQSKARQTVPVPLHADPRQLVQPDRAVVLDSRPPRAPPRQRRRRRRPRGEGGAVHRALEHTRATPVPLDLQGLSGPDDPLVRLERAGPDEYGLSIRWHDDRWQRLPVAGTVDKLVAVLRADYSSLLAAV